MSWRDFKTLAKDVVHSTFQVKVNYYEKEGRTPVLMYVRIHNQEVYIGDVDGTNVQGIQAAELENHIIFKKSSGFEPKEKALVAVTSDEVYIIREVFFDDIDYIKTRATRLLKNQIKPNMVAPT